MDRTLNEIERRVLGVLLEKALAQPAYYPMSLNAVSVACNQKNNRDPVMDIDEDTAWDALESLRSRGLVSRALTGPGSRVDKFKHDVATTWNLQGPQRAVLAELLLRGPQTLSELKTRCARMSPFESLDAVKAVLDALAQLDPPFVALLPRQPGQREQRYQHLLYPPGEKPRVAPEPAETAGDRDADSPQPAGAAQADVQAALADLQSQVLALQERVRRLELVAGAVARPPADTGAGGP